MSTDGEDLAWGFGDEQFYTFLKHKYADRRQLKADAEEKRKAAEKMIDGKDPHYHRMAVTAEMAQLRLDMAYIIDKNNKLEQYIETIEYLHQKVGVLEGAYGYVKMLAENLRIDYSRISDLYKKLNPTKEPAK